MAEDQGQTYSDHKTILRAGHQPAQTRMGLGPGLATPAYPTSMLGDSRLSGRGNSSVKAAMMLQMQQTCGNRAVQRMLARAKKEVQRACACEPHTGSGGEAEGYQKESGVALQRIGTSPAATNTVPTIAIMRKITVEDPADKISRPIVKGRREGIDQTNAVTVKNYLTKLCPTGKVGVDGAGGEVTIDGAFCKDPAGAKASKTQTGCGCICDLVESKNKWKILVDDKNWPHTIFDDDDAALGKKKGGSGGIVTTPSPNSPKLWGASTASGNLLDTDPWLVLGHELCGHAWLGNSGQHAADETPPRGKGGHQATVKRENLLRKEHGIELRGTFKDPNCGESYWRKKSSPKKVNWSGHRAVCEAWRKEYNKKNKTNYKITDKIP